MTARKKMSYTEKGRKELIVSSRYLFGTSRHFVAASVRVREQITSGGPKTSWEVLSILKKKL